MFDLGYLRLELVITEDWEVAEGLNCVRMVCEA